MKHLRSFGYQEQEKVDLSPIDVKKSIKRGYRYKYCKTAHMVGFIFARLLAPP